MVNESILKTAEKFVSLIPENLGVKKSYLFGLYAKGMEREEIQNTGIEIDIHH